MFLSLATQAHGIMLNLSTHMYMTDNYEPLKPIVIEFAGNIFASMSQEGRRVQVWEADLVTRHQPAGHTMIIYDYPHLCQRVLW